jgi:hypothetical protein
MEVSQLQFAICAVKIDLSQFLAGDGIVRGQLKMDPLLGCHRIFRAGHVPLPAGTDGLVITILLRRQAGAEKHTTRTQQLQLCSSREPHYFGFHG